jgi:hypothetical protein
MWNGARLERDPGVRPIHACRRLRSVVRQRRELSWHTSDQWDGRVFVVEFHVGGHERAWGGHERAVLWCVCDISERGVCTWGVCSLWTSGPPWGPMLRHGFDMCERVNVSETRPHTATWTDAHSLALHSTRASRNANGQTNSATCSTCTCVWDYLSKAIWPCSSSNVTGASINP